MRLLTVVGARPQFIKAAAVSAAIALHNGDDASETGIREVLVHTGQHYDHRMSQLFFEELRLPRPAYHLGVGSGSPGAQTGRMMEEIERVLLKEKPDAVLLYGDTNSTLAGALAAAKSYVPVAHVEAGLRSYNRRMPEEVNRLLTDHLSTWLFCPTETAVANLRQEGITTGVQLVGDVMYELLREHAPRVSPAPLLARLGLEPRGYALATVHRAENTDMPERLRAIFGALSALSSRLPVVCPVHPRTRDALPGTVTSGPRLHLVEPVGYLEMLGLERDARLVLTDSGGVQKEAHWLGVPCVTLREETEWVETLATGGNVLAGADPERIAGAATAMLRRALAPPPGEPARRASGMIVETLARVGR